MNANFSECYSAMDKIKKELDNLKINSIITRNKNILCKVKYDTSTPKAGTPICSHSHEHNCPYSECKYPDMACRFHKDKPKSKTSNGDTLIRMMPTDIYNGIFLHVIKLDGEICDLKMSFGYAYEDIKEIIDVIKFIIE